MRGDHTHTHMSKTDKHKFSIRAQHPHITLKLRTCEHRLYLKVLNQLFPPNSVTDNKHMTCHLADIVWHYTHYNNLGSQVLINKLRKENTASQRLARINDILAHISIGTPQPMVIASIIIGLGHKHGTQFYNTYLLYNVLFRDVESQRTCLQKIRTYIHKCASNLDGTELSNGEKACCAYDELMYGRSLRKSDWITEENNRCYGTAHLDQPNLRFNPKGQYIWKDENTAYKVGKKSHTSIFYSDLQSEIYKICKPLVTRRNTKESFQSFYMRRHEWMASGSSAGFRITDNEIKDKSISNGAKLIGVKG